MTGSETRVRISAAINTYNEEANIERCLASIAPHVDEIVISDMHSTDRTVEICERFGCKIGYQQKILNTAMMREEPVARASHDWIFIIDADETAPAELFAKLREIAAEDAADIVDIPRINTWFGINFTDGGFPLERIQRFFKKGSIEFIDHPHRWGKIAGRVVQLPFEDRYAFMHYGVGTVYDWIRKMNDYTEYEARSLAERGLTCNFRRLLLRPLRVFWHHYWTLKGYRKGLAGLAFSALWMAYWQVAAVKLWEQQRQDRK